MSKKIAVLGDMESIMAFSTLGVDVFEVSNEKETQQVIQELVSKEYKIIYITDRTAEKVKEIIDYYKSVPFPAIILIPDRLGSTGFGMSRIMENVEKAIGTNIFNNDDLS